MSTRNNILYSFDSFVVEVDERRLWQGDKQVSLTPKAFDTLLVLLEHYGKIVSKDILLNEVWKDTFVEESTLAQNISTLRKTLGFSADGKPIIETVPRRGYRFLLDVSEIADDDQNGIVRRYSKTQITTESKRYIDEIIGDTSPALEISVPNAEPTGVFRKIVYKNRFNLAITAIVLCLGTIAVWFGGRVYLRSPRLSSSGFSRVEVSKLTSDGNVSLVKVSPNGDYLAMVVRDGDFASLGLRTLENASPIEIVPKKKQQFIGLTFSLDGKQIYFATYDKEADSTAKGIGILYKVSTLGGPIQQIAEDVDSPITLSPDNRHFAFIRRNPDDQQSVVVVRAFDDKQEKKLAARRLSEFFSPTGLAWSPDGHTIAAVAYSELSQMDVVCIDVDTGEQNVLSSRTWQWAGFPNWFADGSGVIVSAYSGNSGDMTDEIWRITFPDGATQKISSGTNGIMGLSLTADSRSLVAVQSKLLSSFWTLQVGDQQQPIKIRQTLPEYNVPVPGIRWTPNGKIIFGSTLNGNLDLWAMDADGSHEKQITNDEGADSMPLVSSDGQDIFFVSNRSGSGNLWRMKADGSVQTQLTFENGVSSPSFSADGKSIFYTSVDKSNLIPYLRRISIDGGESVQLTSASTLLPEASPDGKWIACYFPSQSLNGASAGELSLTVISSGNARVFKQWETRFPDGLSPIVWSDDNHFNYATSEVQGSRLWSQGVDEDTPKILVDSPDEKILRFAWSPNRRQIVYEKGRPINDILLIRSV